MSGVLRWGILSTADIGRKKVIPGIVKANRCEVVAIGSRDETLARRTADELGIPRVHGSYQALVDDPDVDAIYIPLPNHLHAEWTLAAARAGKHVLCEKPLAMTADEAQTMVDGCEAAGVRLMEAFMYRQHPSWIAAKEIVDSGRLGRLTTIQSWFSYYNDDPANIRNQREAGGGAVYDIGCYTINLSRLLFGGEPTRIQSSVRIDPTTGVDTLASAILDFPDGIASFTVSTRVETDQRVHVYGDRGRLSIEIPFNIPPDRPTRVFVTAGGEPPVAPATETLTFETKDPYTAEAEAFAAAILDGSPIVPPPADAVANMRIIDAILGSSAAHPG